MDDIGRDEGMDRTYIPLPGGFEVQTKGKGSTFRIYDGENDFRLPVYDQPYLFDILERMARASHEANRELTRQVEQLQAVLRNLIAALPDTRRLLIAREDAQAALTAPPSSSGPGRNDSKGI